MKKILTCLFILQIAFLAYAQKNETSVEGAGEIVATDNGDAVDFTSFQSHDRKTFNGMALVIVKAKKGMSGNIVVKAAGDGFPETKVVIKSM